MPADFLLRPEGLNLVLLTPVTDDAKRWVYAHLPPECLRFGLGRILETRYAGPVLEGIAEAGLTIQEE